MFLPSSLQMKIKQRTENAIKSKIANKDESSGNKSITEMYHIY